LYDGIYWISDMLLIVFGKMGWVTSSDATSIALFYFIWGLFTVGIFVGTLKLSRPIQAFFLTLAILFFLLTAFVLTNNPTLALITGIEGILCGAIGVYIGL
jgi:succinate-acetate transporter protein